MEHAGAAAATTLSSSITNASTTINVASATGWPLGSVGPFVVTIDAGTASEEKVLVTSRTGIVLTVQTRGYDGTTATSHGATAAIIHSFSATEADEANVAAVAVGPGTAWTAYTPAVHAATTVTVNASGCAYTKIGRTVHVRVRAVVSSASASGGLAVGLPVTSVVGNADWIFGTGFFYDASAGTVISVFVQYSTTSEVGFRLVSNPAGAISTDLGAGDVISFPATYESA